MVMESFCSYKSVLGTWMKSIKHGLHPLRLLRRVVEDEGLFAEVQFLKTEQGQNNATAVSLALI